MCPINYVEADLLTEAPSSPDLFDCITDHLTTNSWLLMDLSDYNQALMMAKQIVTYYASLLKLMGKMILHYEIGQKPFRKQAIEQAMIDNQLQVVDIYPILDIYELPKLLQRIFQDIRYMHGGLDERNRLGSYYPSEGVLIAQKPEA